MRIAVIQGTRPEIVKNYAVVKALAHGGIAFEVLHTGQHTDRRMCANIYSEMDYEPDRTLPGRHRLGTAIDWLQKVLKKDNISHVIVNGDTTASLAGALAAMYLDVDVAHIEAGLRSGDIYMREERNRIMVDSIAGSLFAYTEYEERVLRQTPTIRGSIYLEGNTTVDVLHDFSDRIDEARGDGHYVFVTLHRKELTDSRERLASVVGALRKVAEERCSVIFPIHPRTADALKRCRLDKELGQIQAIDPVGPFCSLGLQKYAAAVLTDSGCIQEEAYLLGVPCVTLRNNTERHLTVAHGANVVTGFAPPSILGSVAWACNLRDRDWPQIYGLPGGGQRIVKRIVEQAPADQRRPSYPDRLIPGEAL